MALFVVLRSCHRFISSRSKQIQNVSNLKWKLQQYEQSGKLYRSSVREAKRKTDQAKSSSVRSSFRDGLTPQKALLLLKSRYDGTIILDETGNTINLNALTIYDLKVGNAKSLQLFNGLMKVKKVSKRNIDDRLLMTLTGVTKESVKDSYFVARDVSYLLEKDNDINRAMEVCRLARTEGAVGINAIIEWCLRRSKQELARKVLVTRGKWGIPLSPATLVTYFSGLSDCHEWGNVPDSLAADVQKKFEGTANTTNIETFNAALRLLSKNYSDDQTYAWHFFEKLGTTKVNPDAQTFTIFLQGLKSYYKKNVEEIQTDPSISSDVRTKKLFQQQAILISRANMVFDKAKSYAEPSKPPSEQEFKNNPKKFSGIARRTKSSVLDIDRHLAVAFLSCYCDISAGTSWSNKSGSHYWYLQQVLIYLQAWMPEVTSILEFATSKQDSRSTSHPSSKKEIYSLICVEPSMDLKRKTDERTKKAGIGHTHLPQNVVQEKSMSEINPWMLFPPSPYAHRHAKQYLTGIERQLVDFARAKTSDIKKEFVEDRENRMKRFAEGGRGAFIRKKRSSLRRESQGINKFLLRIFLDCLLRLGLVNEFYKAMWLSISTWSDIKIDHKKLRESESLKPRVISKNMYPAVDFLSPPSIETGFYQSGAQLSVIDIGLVEDFIHKIGEHIPSSLNPSAFAVEVLAAYSNRRINNERNLRPRPSTFGAIFAMLNKDMHRCNDRNVTIGYQNSARKNLPDNTAKSSLNFDQLNNLLDSLDILVRCIFARFGGKSMDSFFLNSFNNLVSKIYSVTWNGAANNSKNALVIHRKIIHCGILMYRPQSLINKQKEQAYSRLIIQSLNFVYNALNTRKDLSRDEVNLMMNLRNLFNLEKERELAESKFESLQMEIYQTTSNMGLTADVGVDLKKPFELNVHAMDVQSGVEVDPASL